MTKKDKFYRSLLPEALRGVVMLYTGQAGAGKTIGSLIDPNNTVLIDADYGKSKVIAESKPKMGYVSVNSNERDDLVKTGENFLKAIDGIDLSKTTMVVFDNIYEIEQGVGAYVAANPIEAASKFNLIAKNITSKAYGHDTLANERLVKGIFNHLIGNDVSVIVVAHMKEKWLAPGQLEIRGRKWLYEAASMVGIFIRTGSAPDVLVFKNAFVHHVDIDPDTLSDEDFDKCRRGEMSLSQVYQRIPNRIPAFTPQKLLSYLNRTTEEISQTPYSSEETLSEDEMAPYREILSKQQRANIEKLLDAEEAERVKAEKIEESLRESQMEEVKRDVISMLDDGVANVKIASDLKIKYPTLASEISPVFVVKIKNEQ